ncbi:uncharacterized protein B0H18DRAFT_1124045 [Fomitopsis serialis]|uniref:uncharacterized protein n=1 Tax=Fomitopsis serialis TaxID=139415 RepID=UPI002008C30F|nr:uncharacterized protein B0H18DRAFT_1124045 [Neoantrodia serialis]KAH9916828.1 hypothetical protein B0H18DRAFT_1124045 [Neoantrodia serialis]
MLLFWSVFVRSFVALAFVASLAPSVLAAPWWPMHYVLDELSPDMPPPQSAAAGIVPAASMSSSAATPSETNVVGATKSSGNLDDTTQQSGGASVVDRSASTVSILVGSTVIALYLVI